MTVRAIRVALGTDSEARLKAYLQTRILGLNASLKDLFDNRVVRWRKAYDAVPEQEVRTFPFKNASNLVVPIVAIHTDTLLARLMAGTFKTAPIWVTRAFGSHKGEAEPLRSALEEFMTFVGIEPGELDLYRVYREWYESTIKLGTSVLKFPWEEQVENIVQPTGDGIGSYDFIPHTVYRGPRPEKLPFENFLIPPAAKYIEAADFKAHIRNLQKHELEARRFHQVYDPKAVDELLKRGPDRTHPSYYQTMKEQDSGARTVGGYDFGEWDVHECWFKYNMNGRALRLIVSYHLPTNSIMRAVYNFYPDNEEPFVASRLCYKDDQFFGVGFAEMLWSFQEEISQIHNQRRDNSTVANTRVWRVDPDSKLNEGYEIYPSAMLPAKKDEVEAMGHGEIGTISIEEERLAIELGERRSGVSPPQQGYGAGIMHGRRGVYTAQGTLSLLQEGSDRTNLNVTDMRHAHTKVGRLIAKMYAHFGAEDKVRQFGEMGSQILEALAAVRSGRIALPVYAATASINREVEKQNDIMLTGVVTRHYSMVASLLQQIASPMLSEETRDYLSKTIRSADRLMKQVLKHFGHDDVDSVIPEPRIPNETSSAPSPQQLAQMVGASGRRQLL